MSFFRSEPMVLCHLILHKECAFDCIVELGYEGKVQFLEDEQWDQILSNKFTTEYQRSEELLQTMKQLQEEINRFGMHTVYYDDADMEKPKESDLPQIEKVIKDLSRELDDVQSHCDALQRRRLALYEHRQVLEKMEQFLTGARNTESQITSSDSIMEQLIKDIGTEEEGGQSADDNGSLIIVAGSIPAVRFAAFELMVWRVSRGNAFVKHEMFELPEKIAHRFSQRPLKYAFMVAFVGERLHQKIYKICQGFEIKVYPLATTSDQRQRDLQDMIVNYKYLLEVFEKTCEHKKRVLSAACGDLFIWRAKIRKMHQAYYLLNRFGVVREARRKYFKYLKSDCWVPKIHMPAIHAALKRVSNASAVFPPLLIERQYRLQRFSQPTYFSTNKFTRGFQSLIDAYGIATYRELNPAPYTIITFPFLFAVMFGDVGHGILMALFAFALICCEKKILRNQKEALSSSEIFDLLFAGRYIILLMGIFSIYTGFIYNDILSKSMNIFGSSWRANFMPNEVLHSKSLELDPANKTSYLGNAYIFGLDPVWNAPTENGIILHNSLKMKMAIILGVSQMMFGLALSGWNALFFRSKTDFFLVFLPQIIFLTSLFFYLVFLIFYKWLYYGGHKTDTYRSLCGPSILITFINMVLLNSGEEPPKRCNSTMFPGELELERVLLFIALASVPVLLCGKPLHFMHQSRRMKRISDPEMQEEIRRSTLNSLRKSLIYDLEMAEPYPLEASYNPEDKLSEIWIHQGIHTIECVLGSVSHTASYLRLWALSLAHNQLSEVLWEMILAKGLVINLGYFNSIIIFITFAAFAALTVAILVVMEGLSAFLHTLRLHWVEFQSKFYGGLGEAFSPFYFHESRKKDSYT